MGPSSLFSAMADQSPAAEDTHTLPPLYAVVVVDTALRQVTSADAEEADLEDEGHLTRAFHYCVPDALRAHIRLGQLVWVPFGARYLQGIVVRFDDRSPVEATKDIDQIVDPQPVLSSIQIDLAHWISDHYLAPIQHIVFGMLPPGITQDVDIIISLLPDAQPSNPTETQAQFLALLQSKGPLSLRQIAHLSKHRNWRGIIEQLVNRGWAAKRAQIRPPQVRPKLVTVVRAKPGATSEDTPKAFKQARAFQYLLARKAGGDEWEPLSDAARNASVAPATLQTLVERGLAELAQRQIWRDPLEGQEFVPVIPPPFTPEQDGVWQTLAEDLERPADRPFLLQGVTGSGKTEIYLRAVQRVLAQGRSAIVLVPEIALTPQTIRRFGARFASTIAVMHSHLSPGERYDQWRRLRAGELRLVIGSRSAIFAPLNDLGLVVLDEEHEPSYKQEKTPRYHAREVAIKLAQLAKATCILGSATPDIESAYRAERGEYVRLDMPRRIMGHRDVLKQQSAKLEQHEGHFHALGQGQGETMYAELPPVQVVDMRAELRAGNTSIFSRPLQKAITVALAAHEQIILFINRRGASTFVMCRDCGHVLKCPRCDLPLTYHSDKDDLSCHHCNYTTFVPPQCPSCWSGRIRHFGVGTQRVEELTQQAYPQARIVRWDRDTTEGKPSHEQLLDRFIRGEADIMVGTQMIAKGLDLPKVTLVGVIAADTMINLPDFRAGERAFQLLTQVAGRAGRSVLGGKVILQTYMPDHPAVQAASHHDYAAFYAQEIAFRRQHWYPPLSRLALLLYTHSNADKAREEASRLHRLLLQRITQLGLPEIGLIGPAPAFFARLRGQYRWQVIVRGNDPAVLLRDVRLPLGWRVDVDPVSLL